MIFDARSSLDIVSSCPNCLFPMLNHSEVFALLPVDLSRKLDQLEIDWQMVNKAAIKGVAWSPFATSHSIAAAASIERLYEIEWLLPCHTVDLWLCLANRDKNDVVSQVHHFLLRIKNIHQNVTRKCSHWNWFTCHRFNENVSNFVVINLLFHAVYVFM